MKILFAAPKNAWGGIFYAIRSELPQHHLEATGCFAIDSLKGFDVLIPTMCPVTKELLESGDRLRLIQQCGTGLDAIDLEAARKLSIWVANVPTAVSGSADSVAELGIYFLTGLSRNIRGVARSLAEQKMGEPVGRTLSGSTVGIVGLGGVGRALARRLSTFNARLIGIKRYNQRKAKEELGLEWAGKPEDLNRLLSRSDYVILCLPLTPETKSLMNRETFSAMKQEAFLINLARGGLVDRDALEEALASGRIAGAGMDVFWQEPPDPNDPIFKHNVLATPHIGSLTGISIRGVVKIMAENIRRLEKNQKPRYCAN